MDDVQVLYPKERITLYGINSNCELFLPIARSSFPSYFPFCFCSLLLQRRAVAALLSPGEVHGVVLCIALVFLSFLRFLLYSVDWTSVGHSLRCGSLGLETSTLNSLVALSIRTEQQVTNKKKGQGRPIQIPPPQIPHANSISNCRTPRGTRRRGPGAAAGAMAWAPEPGPGPGPQLHQRGCARSAAKSGAPTAGRGGRSR